MDYTAADFWWKVTITLMNMAIGVYLFWERNNNATKNRIDELEGDVDKRLDDQGSRLMRVETQVQHLPQVADLEKLYERVRTVDHTTTKMEGEFQEVRRTLSLIHSYLMTKDKS
ncbi:MAG: DUF2730 family protein [Thiobacillus sp.]